MRQHGVARESSLEERIYGKQDGASFQIIVLGPSGGPREDNITGLLVRAPQSEWRKGSLIAVDAGAHLASIVRILEQHMPKSSDIIPPKGHSKVLEHGPFAGIKFPCISAKANALHIFRELLHSVLITHPHLDHMAGIAINTPALEYGREAKAIVALPSTIDAIKNHIFNDSIWPNLSDEGHGVGFVTYRRLIEGGNPRLGLGEARGYVNVCDGLATKCWGVSHGKCHRRAHSLSHQRGESFGWNASDYNFPSRRMSRISDDHGYFAAMAYQQNPNIAGYSSAMPTQMPMPIGQATPGIPGGSQPASALDPAHMFEPVMSSAFFIRNDVTGHELLIFGDIEPDSISISPRNHIVWDDAAHKIAAGSLKAILIECSFDDSVRNEDLYGHLCPRHLIAELTFLAKCVITVRKQKAAALERGESYDGAMSPVMAQMPNLNMEQPPTPAEVKRKRKRGVNGEMTVSPDMPPSEFVAPASPQLSGTYVGKRSVSNSRRKTSRTAVEGHTPEMRPTTPSARGRSVQFQAPLGSIDAIALNAPPAINTQVPMGQPPPPKEKLPEPLKGLSVHIIHVKDTMMDGPAPGDIIIEQIRKQSAEAGLGAEFDVTSYGQSIWI